MKYVLLALALTGLVSMSSPNDKDADTKRVARFGIQGHFYNQLKKTKDKNSGNKNTLQNTFKSFNQNIN